MAKQYPLDVMILRDDEGRSLLSKGHHPVSAFLAACEKVVTDDPAAWGLVRHQWMRCIPNPEGGVEYVEAKEGSRGAFPVSWVCDYDWADDSAIAAQGEKS